MDEKIIYSIKDIAVNPDLVGVIVAPYSADYIFENPSEVPEEVRQITDHFRSGTPLDYALLDCTTHTTLATVNFSRIEGLNLMDSVFFFSASSAKRRPTPRFRSKPSPNSGSG